MQSDYKKLNLNILLKYSVFWAKVNMLLTHRPYFCIIATGFYITIEMDSLSYLGLRYEKTVYYIGCYPDFDFL